MDALPAATNGALTAFGPSESSPHLWLFHKEEMTGLEGQEWLWAQVFTLPLPALQWHYLQ